MPATFFAFHCGFVLVRAHKHGKKKTVEKWLQKTKSMGIFMTLYGKCSVDAREHQDSKNLYL